MQNPTVLAGGGVDFSEKGEFGFLQETRPADEKPPRDAVNASHAWCLDSQDCKTWHESTTT